MEGAKTKDELLFIRELKGVCNEKNLTTTTEDGTYGLQCMVTEPLAKLLDREKFDMIYTCGPEVMVKKIFELTEQRKLPLEASLGAADAVRHRLVRKLRHRQVPRLQGWSRVHGGAAAGSQR